MVGVFHDMTLPSTHSITIAQQCHQAKLDDNFQPEPSGCRMLCAADFAEPAGRPQVIR